MTDIEVVFNRTLSIIGSEEADLHHLSSHELALFLDDGSMISASLKKKKLNHYVKLKSHLAQAKILTQ